MPVGDQEFITVAAQSAISQTEEAGQVEGGRETWEQSVERGRRKSKRKINVNRLTEQSGHVTQQQVSYDMMSGVAPANQHQYQEEHNPSKRQHLDQYIAELPPEEQNHGYGEVNISTTDVTVNHHQEDLPVQEYCEGDTQQLSGGVRVGEEEGDDEEDLMSLMRRLQAEATELLAKCGEALSEGIEYEAFFPVRIDKMLRGTHDLEQSLLTQRQAMKDRLHEIASLL